MITVSGGVGVSSYLVEVWTCDHSEWRSGHVITLRRGVDCDHSEWSGHVIAFSGGVDL